MPQYSILIFSNHEPRTIERAIFSCVKEVGQDDYELIVIAPDKETEQIVRYFQKVNSRIIYLKDEGKGKPAAVNLAITRAQSDILIFTDGDVFVGNGSIRKLLAPLEQDEIVGAVSGHPVPQNSRANKFGFWAHILTQAGAHEMRLERQSKGESIEASAYLMGVRKSLIEPLPEDTFADDQLISYMVLKKEYRIAYASDALVHVKYPTNFHDWKLQKVRSVAGYYQSYARHQDSMRSGLKEASGLKRLLAYPKNIREFWWLKQLIVARGIVWLSAWWAVNVKKKSFGTIWKRVESTK